MDLGPLRALALELNLGAHGVAATVTRPAPDDTAIVTRGLWITTPLDEPRAYGTDFQRREARRVLTLPRAMVGSIAGVPTMPRGTIVVAPDKQGDVTTRRYMVDEIDRTEADHWRVVLVKRAE